MSETSFPTPADRSEVDSSFAWSSEPSSSELQLESAAARASTSHGRPIDGLALIARLAAVREVFFPAARYPEPVWKVLLEIAQARADARPAELAMLMLASGIPARSARRCIDVLVEDGLIGRVGPASDRDRAIYALTATGAATMDRYAHAVGAVFA